MGATAAQSEFGKITPINKNRGRLIELEDGILEKIGARGLVLTVSARYYRHARLVPGMTAAFNSFLQAAAARFTAASASDVRLSSVFFSSCSV
jgi:hypothetical protein